MLILTFVIFLFLNVMCNGSSSESFEEHGKQGKHDKNMEFYVKIEKRGSAKKRMYHYNDGHDKTDGFEYIVGEPIQLTCSYKNLEKPNVGLLWSDSYGFTTDYNVSYHSEIRLKFTPDADDHALQLSCITLENRHQYIDSPRITVPMKIRLGHQSNNSKALNKDQVKFINTGQELKNNETSNAYVIWPAPHIPQIVSPNKTITKNFTREDNGTIILYIKYECVVHNNDYTCLTFNRTKDKHVLYEHKTDQHLGTDQGLLLDGVEIDPDQAKTLTNYNPFKVLPLEKNEASNDSRMVTLIVVLGSIILVLISVIIIIWYRHKRSRASDEAADQVIYAEIEDMPSQTSRPSRDEQPYARIIGSLVPKHQTTFGPEEDLYCTVK